MRYRLHLPSSTDPVYQEMVLALWRRGFDTYDIARLTGEHESTVCTTLRRARERQT